MSLIVGWNKGGVGTSTLHKILKDAGVCIDEHKSGSAYQKGYKARLLPVCSNHDLFILGNKQIELNEIRDADPDCKLFLIFNNFDPKCMQQLQDSANEYSLTVLSTLPSRVWFKDYPFNDYPLSMMNRAEADINEFVSPISKLLSELE